MDVEIAERGSVRLAGLHYAGKDEQGEIRALWHTFLNRVHELGIDVEQPWTAYGASRLLPGGEPGAFEYLAAAELAAGERLPAGMVVWEAPAGPYAVAVAQGLSGLMPVMTFLFETWLPQSAEWAPAGGPALEIYPPSFATDGRIQVCVPVRRR